MSPAKRYCIMVIVFLLMVFAIEKLTGDWWLFAKNETLKIILFVFFAGYAVVIAITEED